MKIKKDAYNCEECVITPPVDICETENEYVITADMPGVTRDRLEITLENNELSINGHVVTDEEREKNRKYAEYQMYNYCRSFTVGDGIDRSAITANLDNGVLTLTLPKSAHVKPRKIEIQSGN
jgi:HSP20 family protein